MLFKKSSSLEMIDFNKGYEYFLNHNEVILLCTDEVRKFDERHPVGAQCFPLRVIDSRAEVELDKDYIYYTYAINLGAAKMGTNALLKKGFQAYCLGSLVDFKGPEEGFNKKNRRKRR